MYAGWWAHVSFADTEFLSNYAADSGGAVRGPFPFNPESCSASTELARALPPAASDRHIEENQSCWRLGSAFEAAAFQKEGITESSGVSLAPPSQVYFDWVLDSAVFVNNVFTSNQVLPRDTRMVSTFRLVGSRFGPKGRSLT